MAGVADQNNFLIVGRNNIVLEVGEKIGRLDIVGTLEMAVFKPAVAPDVNNMVLFILEVLFHLVCSNQCRSLIGIYEIAIRLQKFQ